MYTIKNYYNFPLNQHRNRQHADLCYVSRNLTTVWCRGNIDFLIKSWGMFNNQEVLILGTIDHLKQGSFRELHRALYCANLRIPGKRLKLWSSVTNQQNIIFKEMASRVEGFCYSKVTVNSMYWKRRHRGFFFSP